MALSRRLAVIDSLIGEQYDEVWDCCCDHGLLGIELIKRKAAPMVNFVDIVPNLMTELETKLTLFSPWQTKPHWQVLCQDVATINLNPNQKNMIVIAGVGGELLLSLVKNILTHYSQTAQLHNNRQAQPLEFIICPVHHAYTLRSGLRKLKLGLKNEVIVTENKRFYEVLHLSQAASTSVSATGEMWDFTQSSHKKYHAKLIKHYQQMQNKNTDFYADVLNQYNNLLDTQTTLKR